MTVSIMNGLSKALTHAISLILVCAMLALSASPANARFISPDDYDPTLPGVGTNRYAYAQNDPVNKSDPNGHAVPVVIAIIIGIISSFFGGTTEANAPGPSDSPTSTSNAQQAANMAAGAAAGVKAAAALGTLARETIKKRKAEKEDAKRAALKAASLETSNMENSPLQDPPSTKPPHGNTLDERPATLYEKYDKDGSFEKHGITQHENPNKRYTKTELGGGEAKSVERGPRVDMAKKERDRIETNPGPKNNEPYAGKRKGGPV